MIGGESLWNVGSAILPVVIFYFLYRIVRSYWKVVVNCWFCNENVFVSYCNQKAFVCPNCGQYNGFKEDGDYDRFIPEQKYEFLNPLPKKKVFFGSSRSLCSLDKQHIDNVKMNEGREPLTATGLCQKCNMQQARIQSQINKFEPRNEANFSGEFEVYKARLHKSYPLCSDCEHVVKRKLEQDKKFGLNQIEHIFSVSSVSRYSRYSHPSQRDVPEVSEVLRRGRSHQRCRAAVLNCGLISNCLNMITFCISCCLFLVYLLKLQNSATIYLFDFSQLLPCYVLSSWIPFLMCHVSKMILIGLSSHITSVIVMQTRRSLPDIVSFLIWCVLLFLKSSGDEKQELLLSQLSFLSVLCVVSFAVAFFPRKLLHRKRPNNIMQSAFSIANTPLSQCSTLSECTSRSASISGSARNKTVSSHEATPARDLGQLFNSLSLGDDLSPSQRSAILRQRRGPFDSMKKPVLAEPRLRSSGAREKMFLDSGMNFSASRYVRSFAPSVVTSVSMVPEPSKFTFFNTICMLGMLFSLALNVFLFCKMLYFAKS